METILKYLNIFQRCIVRQMLLSNAELIGWNSRDGTAMVQLATNFSVQKEHIEMYRTDAMELTIKTL